MTKYTAHGKHDPDLNALLKVLAFLIILLIVGLFIGSISGCTPEARLSKLLKNHPELTANKTTVVVRHDTIVSKEIRKDSTIKNIYSKDTVFLKENRLTIKYLYKGGDSAYLGGVVKADTIIKVERDTIKSKTIVQQVKAPKDGWEWLQFWLTIAVLAFVAIKYIGPPAMKILSKIPGWPF